MSTSSYRFDQLIQALNQATGLQLTSQEGVCAFTDRQQAYWQLSCGDDSNALHVHTTIDDVSAYGPDVMRRLLVLNTDPKLLRGAALGLCEHTDEIELLYTVALEGLDGDALAGLLDDLMTVRDAVKSRLREPVLASTEPRGDGNSLAPHPFAFL